LGVLEAFRNALHRDPTGTLARFIALQVRGIPAARRSARVLLQALYAGGLPGPQALDTALSWLTQSDLRPVLGRVGCPTRLILGERDVLVPPDVLADILAYCPRWDCVLLHRAGHAPFASDPAAFAREVLREIPSLA
jgi:pimeloyl-[acyl-carrier protein] methyl ester esterase